MKALVPIPRFHVGEPRDNDKDNAADNNSDGLGSEVKVGHRSLPHDDSLQRHVIYSNFSIVLK
jgi:hypothetical protein